MNFKGGWQFQKEKTVYAATPKDFKFVKSFASVTPLLEKRRRQLGDFNNPFSGQESDYVISQTESAGCTGYGTARGIEAILRTLYTVGESVVPFRALAVWVYANINQHIYRVYQDAGATMLDAMDAINRYGAVPSRLVQERHTSAFKSDTYIDGALSEWYLSSGYEAVSELYDKIATDLQLVTAIPRTEVDIVLSLQAGSPVVYGSLLEPCFDKYDKTYTYGEVMPFGHCQCLGGWWQGGTYNANSWEDGVGKLPLAQFRKLQKDKEFCCYTIVDIERERFDG